MARPTTKNDLINASNEEYHKLITLIDSLSPQEQQATFEFEDRDRNIRDVLAHLHQWHQMMLQWYDEGTVQNIMPIVPGEGYTWRTLPAMNLEIWKSYQNADLDDIKVKLNESHQKVMDIIQSHSNEELFTQGVYRWTKGTTLGAYFVSNTSSHYAWAIKKIKKHKKLISQ